MARRTAEQAKATRERIVMAAAAAFSQCGFSQPSLERIAADAGVTRGSLYGHFQGKRELLDAVGHLIDWPLLQQQPLTPDHNTPDPLGDLRRMVHRWMQEIDADPMRRCVLDIVLHKTEWTEENAELLECFEHSCKAAVQRIRGLLELAMSRGQLCMPLSPDIASATLQAAVLGIISTGLRNNTTASLPEQGDWLLACLLAPHQDCPPTP